MPFYSPLRYPGGKRKLTDFIKQVLELNGLVGGAYVEPFAGGASVALALLMGKWVSRIYVNDLDPGVYAFWWSVLNRTEELCALVHNTPVTMVEWERQRSIQLDIDSDMLAKGFSTFFLNRTNRSGIIRGGVIGGKQQNGTWKLDARFSRGELVRRIEQVASHKSEISLSNEDAAACLNRLKGILPNNSLVYLDPPYYVQGQQKLYTTFYGPNDHAEIARIVRHLTLPWIVTYDDVSPIRELYSDLPAMGYSLHYSVQKRYQGCEVMFFKPGMMYFPTATPTQLSKYQQSVTSVIAQPA